MAGKKFSMKVLAEEFEKLKEEVEGLRPLKQKIVELEECLKKVTFGRVNDTGEKSPRENHEQIEDASEESIKKSWKCKKCETSLESSKSLKKHIKDIHPAVIKCTKCKETFSKNSDLEEHIKNIHIENKQYGCEECGKTFVLKWRLQKHLILHSSSEIKGCHSFNNEKPCSFESLGCMFAHKLMGTCIFSA